MSNDARVSLLLGQQAAMAKFGGFALRQNDLMKILTEAARVCAEGLNVPFSKVCRYRTAENDLLVEAGYGWKAGVVGHVVSRADLSSPQGRAFMTGEPSICNDLRKDTVFQLPPFYAAHGVVSTVDVLIKGDGKPYGVLEIDNNVQHNYDQHDIDFLTGFANVLAEAVSTAERAATLRRTVDRMELLVAEKDRLLEQKAVLAEELQHRVRNNLQLVYGMVSRQLEDTPDPAGRRGMKAIGRRVSTLAQVYDHLLGSEMARMTDFGSYLRSLCQSLVEIQDTPEGTVSLTCETEQVLVDLDAVTALGIVVTELITNSYDHAFPDGRGSITVALLRSESEAGVAVLKVGDSGRGYEVKAESKRHGLGLVRRLIEQVRGSATIDTASGMMWTIKFPIAQASPSALSRRGKPLAA